MSEGSTGPYQTWPMQRVWKEDENSATGMRDRWQQVDIFEDALTSRVQVKALRITWDNQNQYNMLSSHQTTLPDMGKPYIDSWAAMAGVTEGMKITWIKCSQQNIPRGTSRRRVTYALAATCSCIQTVHSYSRMVSRHHAHGASQT